MNKFLVALILLGFLLGGCALGVNGGMGRTPEEAAERASPRPNGVQRIYLVKPAPKGALVIYRDIGAAAQAADQTQVGFSFVTPETLRWTVHESGGMGIISDEPLALSTDSPHSPTGHTIILGLARDPNVATVAVTFGTGQRLTDQVTNGLFAMVAEPKTPPCWLELMDGQGVRLKLVDFRNTDEPQYRAGWEERIKQECPQKDSP